MPVPDTKTAAPRSEGDATGGHRRSAWWIVIVLCIGVLTGINIYRAATQSITHDEAVTYQRYASGPLYQFISSSDANNHVLHSLLCRLAVSVLGPLEIAVRAPSLIGGVLFLVMIARVGWRVWGASATSVLTLLVLGLSPFVMDYLSIARGYSLALGLWVAALDQFLAVVLDSPRTPAESNVVNWDSAIRRASRLLALALLANLTFFPAAVGLAGCWAAWAQRVRRRALAETPREFRRWLWRCLGRPGAIVFASMAIAFVKLRPRQFYYGANTIAESLRSLVYPSFAHHPQTWPWNNQSPWFTSCLDVIALVMVPALALGLIVLWVLAARRLYRLEPDDGGSSLPSLWLFYLSAGTLCLALVQVFALHALGMKLPLERTGLVFLPPFFLALLASGSGVLASAHFASRDQHGRVPVVYRLGSAIADRSLSILDLRQRLACRVPADRRPAPTGAELRLRRATWLQRRRSTSIAMRSTPISSSGLPGGIAVEGYRPLRHRRSSVRWRAAGRTGRRGYRGPHSGTVVALRHDVLHVSTLKYKRIAMLRSGARDRAGRRRETPIRWSTYGIG
jgi:hypothetical protein